MLAWGLPANPETHRDQDENQHKDAPQCPTTYSEPNPPLYVSQPVCPFAPLRLSLRPITHRHRQAVTNGLAVPNHTLIDCVLDEHFPNEANHRGSGGDDQQDPQAMGIMD